LFLQHIGLTIVAAFYNGRGEGSAMILYIVQVSIDREIEADWLAWMKSNHVPAVVRTGCFTGSAIYRVLEPGGDEQRAVYAIHYSAASRQQMDRYIRDFAPALRQEVVDRYRNRFSASRMILEQPE
jgi:hypothetical protein